MKLIFIVLIALLLIFHQDNWYWDVRLVSNDHLDLAKRGRTR